MSYFSGHPHSTYTQKSPKLDPLPSRTQSYHLTPPPFYPLCVRTFYIFTPPPRPPPHPPPNKFLFKFKFSSLTISRLEIYIKKIIYSQLKAGLHFSIHNNKWQCNNYFCTTKEKF